MSVNIPTEKPIDYEAKRRREAEGQQKRLDRYWQIQEQAGGPRQANESELDKLAESLGFTPERVEQDTARTIARQNAMKRMAAAQEKAPALSEAMGAKASQLEAERNAWMRREPELLAELTTASMAHDSNQNAINAARSELLNLASQIKRTIETPASAAESQTIIKMGEAAPGVTYGPFAGSFS